MNKTTLGMALVSLGLIVIAFFQGGFALVGQGFLAGGKTLLAVFPLIIIAFIVAGSFSTLISKEMPAGGWGRRRAGKGPSWGH